MISTSRQKSTEVTVTDVPRGALSPRQTGVIRQSLRNTVRLKCLGATLEILIRVFSLNIEGAEFSEKHNATLEVSRRKPSDYAHWLSKVVKVITRGRKSFRGRIFNGVNPSILGIKGSTLFQRMIGYRFQGWKKILHHGNINFAEK